MVEISKSGFFFWDKPFFSLYSVVTVVSNKWQPLTRTESTPTGNTAKAQAQPSYLFLFFFLLFLLGEEGILHAPRPFFSLYCSLQQMVKATFRAFALALSNHITKIIATNPPNTPTPAFSNFKRREVFFTGPFG